MALRWETRLTEKHLKLKRLMKSAGKKSQCTKKSSLSLYQLQIDYIYIYIFFL